MKSASVVLSLLALPFAVYSGTLQPTTYHLTIDASNLTTSPTFKGSVEMNLTTDTTSEILLNAKNLNVSSVKVLRYTKYNKGWSPEAFKNFTNNGSILQINFPQPLPNGVYSVSVSFEGQYQDTLEGFAKVAYSYNETQKFLGVTRFEPNYARTVFPCVDDPSPRVDLVLDVIVSNQTVFSSVEPNIITNTDTTKVYRFSSYPKMAVYQLGWMIVDDSAFKVLQENTSNIPVFTRAVYPSSNYTAWATNITARLLEATEKYTQIPLPLPKLELLFVPEFFAGAAQSWGVISYSEEEFLVESTKPVTSTRTMHQVALGLAQQTLQQWFGDLVTMDSWSNSWLMKGLTEHLKFSIASTIPNLSGWELNDHEVVELIQPALSMDNTLDEITPLSKLDIYRGGALIRMLHNFMGDSSFKKGVSAYLENEIDSDKNKPSDLWNILYEVAIDDFVDLDKQSVQSIMKGWTDSAGYPILNVTTNGTHFNILQSGSGRFVPVTYLLQGSSSRVSRAWLQPDSSLAIPAGGSKWILLNINQTGYYRVNYHQSILGELAADYTQLPRLSRSQLIDDLFSISLNGNSSLTQLLQFLPLLKAETDYFPWYSALRNLQDLIDKLYGHTSHDLLKSFTLDQMSTVIDEVGLNKKDQDSHTDILKRGLILEKACAFGNSKCLQKAVGILKSWMSGLYYDADLNLGLLCSAVSNSSEEIWRELVTMKIATMPSIRPVVLKGLACSRNVPLLNEFLTNITSKNTSSLNSKERNVFLQTLASTSFGADVLLNWLVGKLNSQMYSGTTTLSPITSPTTTQGVQNLATNYSTGTDNNSSSTRETTSNVTEFNVMARLYDPTPAASESLAEEDIVLILSLIQDKLTTIDQGAKLDNLVASSNNSGLSNSTLQLIQQITVQTYNQDQWARQYNSEIKIWLETTTTSPGVVTKPPATTTGQVPTTAKPTKGAGATLYSSVALTVLLIASHYFIRPLLF